MVKKFRISLTKKLLGRYCCAYGCTNNPEEKKAGLCHKHYNRKRRLVDPIYTRYSQFKGNAKKRGVPFFVTFDQFKWFCKKNNYLTKGRRGQNATIDRRCNLWGYYIWNMQILTNRQNASKGSRPSADCPF
jgi:hypothetical protein